MRLERYTPACRRIIMIHLHHACKYPVVVLAEQLRYYRGEDTQGFARNYVVEFCRVFGLGYARAFNTRV